MSKTVRHRPPPNIATTTGRYYYYNSFTVFDKTEIKKAVRYFLQKNTQKVTCLFKDSLAFELRSPYEC